MMLNVFRFGLASVLVGFVSVCAFATTLVGKVVKVERIEPQSISRGDIGTTSLLDVGREGGFRLVGEPSERPSPARISETERTSSDKLSPTAPAVDHVMFDGATGVGSIFRIGSNNHYIGVPLDFSSLGGRSFDTISVTVASNAGATYLGGIRVNIAAYENYSSISNPVFSSPLTVLSITTGPTAMQDFSTTVVTANLPSPLVFNDSVNNGFVINVQGNTGNGFFDTDNLTLALGTGGTAPKVGSVALPSPKGFYTSNSTNFNFSANDYFIYTGGDVVPQLVIARRRICTSSTENVTSNADDGPGTLRAALASVCDGGTIVFQPGVGDIVLTSGELIVDANVTIFGLSANVSTISANNSGRVFRVLSGVTASIDGLSITGGRLTTTDEEGAGILNSGVLTLRNSAVFANSCTTNCNGGGIRSTGTLNIIGSTVSGNSATKSGGGVMADGSLNVLNSTISGNRTGVTGGGIASGVNASVNIRNALVTENLAATQGGGYYDGTANTNFPSSISVANSIIAGNALTGPTNGPDFKGKLISQGYNLIGVTSGAIITGTTTGNLYNVDPVLAPLAYYGGPTKTHALSAGSPAIDAGSNALAIGLNNQPLDTDQRQSGFLRIIGPSVDIGPFESNSVFPTSATITSDTPASSNVGQFFSATFSVLPVGNSTTAPTGSVTVSDGANSCVGTVAAGRCTLVLDTFGTRTLTATYSGDANYFSSVSPGALHTVTMQPPDINRQPQSVTASEGSTVTFTATAVGMFAEDAPGDLLGGQMLLPGQNFLLAASRGYKLVYQTDGNLVIYRGDGHVTWASGTANTSPGRAEMQTDGNFVVYDAGGVPRFASGTNGNPGSLLRLQPNGNLVIINPGGNVIWQSNTGSNFPIPTMRWQVRANGAPAYSEILNENQTTLSVPALFGSNGNRYRAVFTNPGGSTTSSAALLTVKFGATTTITADTPDPSQQNENVTVSFSVVPVNTATVPTGTVTVTDGLDDCTVPVSAGQCTLALSTFGTRTLVATYSGDAVFAGSVSNGVSHLVLDPSQNLIVDNTSDNGALSACTAAPADCSLRGAISRANAATGDDAIMFDSVLFAAPQTIALGGTELSIANNGKLTINGSGADKLTISGNNASRVFNVASGATAEINSLTVSGGRTTAGNANGGGVLNSGTLDLVAVAVSGNTVAFNSSGGGVSNNGGVLNLTDSTVSGNSADIAGGGIFANGGTLNVTNSTVSGNAAVQFTGGGIAAFAGVTVTLANATVTANSATDSGGGVFNSGSTVNARNSIIAGNSNGVSPDFQGTLTSQGHNLIGNTSGASITGVATGNILNQNPQLSALGYFGGTTKTHALTQTSPAFDAGSNALAVDRNNQPFAFDQRRSPFPRFVGDTVDIGAFEFTLTTPTITSINSDSPDPSSPGQSVTVTFAVVSALSASGTPTGNVTVTDGVDSCTGTVATGQCSLVFTVYGNRTLTATYTGDANFFGSVSNGAAHLANFPPQHPIVDNTTDDPALSQCTSAQNDCSLRGAIALATVATGDDTIDFDPAVFSTPRTITLGGSALDIVGNGRLTINGTGTEMLTVSANYGSRIFIVEPGAVVDISGMSITGGRDSSSSAQGGGILNAGVLSLSNTLLFDNALPNFGLGGAIGNTPTGILNIANSTIRSNAALYGGGVFNNGGSVVVTNSTVSGNVSNGGRGGGLMTENGSLTIVNSTISGNGGAALGGGISNVGRASLNLTNTTISGNYAYAGGGGIYTGGNATATIVNTTISGNGSGDVSTGQGLSGGIQGNFTSRNSIIAGNSSGFTGPDVDGTITSQGHNLIGNTSYGTIIGDTTGNILNQPALLGPLGFYGGPTMTQPLLSGSPAINGGTSTGAPATDQRGAARVGATDIGTFELNSTSNGGTFAAVLPRGQIGIGYNFTLIPEAGTTVYCVSAGSLPPGMTGLANCPAPLAESKETRELAPTAAIVLGGTPTQGGVFNFTVTATNGGNSNVTNYSVNIFAPTAAGVTVAGRVLTNDGRGLRNAVVTITDQNGNARGTRTGSFGYFRFDDVAAGETYVVSVFSKRYRFAPQVVSVSENLDGLNFYP